MRVSGTQNSAPQSTIQGIPLVSGPAPFGPVLCPGVPGKTALGQTGGISAGVVSEKTRRAQRPSKTDEAPPVHRQKRIREELDTTAKLISSMSVKVEDFQQMQQDMSTIKDALLSLTAAMTKMAEAMDDLAAKQPQKSQPRAMTVSEPKTNAPAIAFKPQGNEAATHPARTYRDVVARRPMGHKKDTVTVTAPCQQLDDIIVVQDPSLRKTLTSEPRAPQNHQLVVLRFEKMAHRKKVPAAEWRKLLKERQIVPHTILFPRPNSLELLIPKDQETATRRFFKSIDRTPVDPNPYVRRDGLSNPLPVETLERTVNQRIEMIQFEMRLVAVRYLEQVALTGIELLPQDARPKMEVKLQQVLQEKLSPQKSDKLKLTA